MCEEYEVMLDLLSHHNDFHLETLHTGSYTRDDLECFLEKPAAKSLLNERFIGNKTFNPNRFQQTISFRFRLQHPLAAGRCVNPLTGKPASMRSILKWS